MLAQLVLACGFLQSAKLKQAQEQANNLTKEKESLMQVIQELKARIKQGTLSMLMRLVSVGAYWQQPACMQTPMLAHTASLTAAVLRAQD